MNVRRRDNPSGGDGGKNIKGAVTSRKGGVGQAKPIKNAVGMKPKAQGYKRIKGAISG